MDFHADHQFPILARPGDDLGYGRSVGQVQHGILRVQGLLGG